MKNEHYTLSVLGNVAGPMALVIERQRPRDGCLRVYARQTRGNSCQIRFYALTSWGWRL